MSWWGYVTLHLKGLNIERFINYALANNLTFIEISKPTTAKLIVQVDYACYKKTIMLAKSFELERVEYGGVVRLINFFKQRIGLLFGLGLGLIVFIVCSNLVWRVDVYGLERLNKQQIIEVLSDTGYKVGTNVNKVNTNLIEIELRENFDNISMVSAIKVGCSIVINIKEKEYEEELDLSLQVPLVASRDGVVDSINVVQGTAMVKAGDVVKKGDILIAPFTIDGQGNIINMRAIGEVNANVYVKGEVSHKQGQKKLVRSGNMREIRSLKLMGVNLPSAHKNNFLHYEIEKYEKNLCKNTLLPFIIVVEQYYELVEVVEESSFGQKRDVLIKESIYKAYEGLQSDFEVLSEQTDIAQVDGMYFVTTYLKLYLNIAISEGENNDIHQ